MTVGDVEVAAGEKRFGHIAASQADGSLTRIPVWVASGVRDGPVLYANAAQHGIELNGTEALRRVVDRLDPARMAGTLIGVPIANPPALLARRHYLAQEPEEPYSDEHPHNMNRLWPGDPEGNETARLVHALWREGASKADVIVDLHSWSRWQTSAVLVRADRPASVELAYAFGLRFVSLTSARAPSPDTARGQMLNLVAIRRGKTAITAELRGQWRLFEDSVHEGVRGIENCMKHLGMLSGRPEAAPYYIDIARGPTAVVEAPCTGIFGPYVEAGTDVAAGQTIGVLVDAQTARGVEITAPCDGAVSAIGPIRGDTDVCLSATHAVAEKGDEIVMLYGSERKHHSAQEGTAP